MDFIYKQTNLTDVCILFIFAVILRSQFTPLNVLRFPHKQPNRLRRKTQNESTATKSPLITEEVQPKGHLANKAAEKEELPKRKD